MDTTDMDGNRSPCSSDSDSDSHSDCDCDSDSDFEKVDEEIHGDSRLSSMELPLWRTDRSHYLPWSYDLHKMTAGSSSNATINSSRSGTIVTSAYTSSGSDSRLSSAGSIESAAMSFDLDFDFDSENKEEKIKQIISLVQEFSIPPGGDMSVLERWFEYLGVRWVLHIGDSTHGETATTMLAHAFDNASSWIRALAQITGIISLMVKANPRTISLMGWDSNAVSVALPSICEEEESETSETTTETKTTATGGGKEAAATTILDPFQFAQFILKTVMKMVGLVVNKDHLTASIQFQYQFAQFIRQAMLRMLAFVDVILAPAETTREDLVCDGAWAPYYKYRLNALLSVRGALSSAVTKIQLPQPYSADAQAAFQRIQREIVGLLSAAEIKAGDAIWTRMAQARTRILSELLTEDGDNSNSSGTPTSQGSLEDIHRGSRHVMGYVTFLQGHYNALGTIASNAAYSGRYVPRLLGVAPLDSLLMEMVSCLQENLATRSELFIDRGLRFLFLINNFEFILDNLSSGSDKPASINVGTIRLQIEGYIKSYIQVSWEPLLSCLLNPAPLCFGTNYTALSKFESEFQEIYTTQKQWKVPDPKMRYRLRAKIIDKIIPVYRDYIKNNKATTPTFSPWELENMLEQLFEG